MLEKIREESQGFWAKVILGLVIITFALAGVGSYLNEQGDQPAAEVNGEQISSAQLEARYQQLLEAYGEGITRAQVLEQMISELLLDQAAAEMGLRIGEQQINQRIVATEEFQIDGQFDNQRYNDMLRLNGRTPAEYKSALRVEMTRQQLIEAITGSEFALESEVQQLLMLQQQVRDLRVATVSAANFADQVEITEQDIESYYQANLANYDTQEKVSVNYIQFGLQDLVEGIDVSDAEVEEYFAANQQRYISEPTRTVAHIMVEFKDDKAAAQAEIESIKAELDGGADFAALAASRSEDSFSKDEGGALPEFGKGDQEPAFEQAAFELTEVGQVSDIVETEFGFHLIKLLDAQLEQAAQLADVRDAIESEIKREKAINELFEVKEQVAQLAFEMPDHLDEVAALLDKEVSTSDAFNRQQAPAPFSANAVQQVLFSPELIEDRVNSDVLEVAENQYLVMRIAEYEPVRTKTLDEVAEGIREQLQVEKAQALASEWASQVVTALESEQDVDTLLAEQGVEWQNVESAGRFGGELDGQVSQQAFKLGTETGSNAAVVEKFNGDVAIVQVLAVKQGEQAPAESVALMQRQLQNANAQQTLVNYIAALRAQADIERYSTL